MRKKYSLIFAHYRENLDWLKYLPPTDKRAFNIVVSNSDESCSTGFDADESYLRENTGREAEHYLEYIISHYENLPEVMVFLQGAPWPHFPFNPLDFLDILFGDPQFQHPMCYLGTDRWERHGLPILPDSHVEMILKKGWGDSESIPKSTPFVIGAQFYVRKEVVLARPKDHYERMLAVADHPGGSFAHALEGFWGSVFSF